MQGTGGVPDALGFPTAPNFSLDFDSDMDRLTDCAQGGLWLAKSGELSGEIKVFSL